MVSESGRAVAAHHSVLVFEVVGDEPGALRASPPSRRRTRTAC